MKYGKYFKRYLLIFFGLYAFGLVKYYFKEGETNLLYWLGENRAIYLYTFIVGSCLYLFHEAIGNGKLQRYSHLLGVCYIAFFAVGIVVYLTFR